ncbi:protein kinase domain-containing protein [Nocardia thailandica]
MTSADTTISFGRYRLLGPIDPAGAGDLLGVALDNSLVLLRLSDPGAAAADDFRLRFRHSAIAGMRVGGAGNAAVLDLDSDAEQPWLATQFVPSAALANVIAAGGALDPAAVRALAAGCAAALAGVHATGLVHRDLRPDTVTLTADGVRLGPPGVIPAGHGTPAGPPDFLAPEQAMGLETGAAADIFALGSLLVFAASGHAPFGAPSVPYTLFNIAQRDPDLTGVPDELRELVLGCLRKDPAARPTPAQILDYVGAAPAPPPWPERALTLIGEQRTRAGELLARLPAQAPPEQPTPRDPIERVRAVAVRARAELPARWHAASGRARAVAVVAALALVAVVAGTGFLLTRADPAQAPVTALTLDQLRRIDACPWLKSALDEVPFDAAIATPGGWTLTPSASWGCRAASNKNFVELGIGEFLTFATERTRLMGSVPVHLGWRKDCERSILSAEPRSRAGVVLSFEPVKDLTCDHADAIAAVLARTLGSAPRADVPANALRLVDACDLVDRAKLVAAIGPIADDPAEVGAHSCTFEGRVTAQVTLGSFDPFGAKGERKQVDGLDILAVSGGSKAICTRLYAGTERDGKPADVVTVRIQGGDQSPRAATYCDTAERLLVDAVRHLPKR